MWLTSIYFPIIEVNLVLKNWCFNFICCQFMRWDNQRDCCDSACQQELPDSLCSNEWSIKWVGVTICSLSLGHASLVFWVNRCMTKGCCSSTQILRSCQWNDGQRVWGGVVTMGFRTKSNICLFWVFVLYFYSINHPATETISVTISSHSNLSPPSILHFTYQPTIPLQLLYPEVCISPQWSRKWFAMTFIKIHFLWNSQPHQNTPILTLTYLMWFPNTLGGFVCGPCGSQQYYLYSSQFPSILPTYIQVSDFSIMAQ